MLTFVRLLLFLFFFMWCGFFFFFFFFSSRRRHTRSLCDWSSDVCSSDLRTSSCGSSPPPRARPSCWSGSRPSSRPATRSSSTCPSPSTAAASDTARPSNEGCRRRSTRTRSRVGMSYDEYRGGGLRSISLFGVFVGAAALGALAVSVLAYTQTHHDRAQVKALQARVAHQLAVLRHRNVALGSKVDSTARRLKQKDAGIAPLAARTLKSVFTIQTPDGWLGAGFAAWRQDGDTYFVTANHVVSHTIENNYVDVKRKGGSWAGEVMVRDSQNDLALVRVSGSPAGAAPLWQDVHAGAPPRPGDQLLLIGSPYGLEGTVTTGIVSRVSKRLIQTDAAANPGNSGGPAIDDHGHVVGVLVSGGGENLNFAVPIGRAG